MKKLTRDRVVPIISARVSCDIFGITSRLAGLAELRHQEQNPRQPLLAGVEELIDQIGLGAHAARQQKLEEQVGELVLFVDDAEHLVPLDLIAVQAVMAVADESRSPALATRASSPTKSPPTSRVMVASLPALDSTVTLARPLCR